MPRSRSPTPIYGYREVGDDLYREQFVDGDEPISPVDHPAPVVNLRRGNRIEPSRSITTRATARRQISESSEEPDIRPRTSSLAWDEDDLAELREPSHATDSTQFSVPVDNSIHQSHVDHVNRIRDTLNSPSDQSEEEFIEADTSLDTIRPASRADTALNTVIPTTADMPPKPAGGAGQPPGEVPQGLKPFVKAIKKAEAMWDSDFKRLKAETMLKERLLVKVNKAEAIRDDVVEAIVELESDDTGFFTNQIRLNTAALKEQYNAFLEHCEQCLSNAPVTSTENAVNKVQAARVKASMADTVEDVKELVTELATLDEAKPHDVPAYFLHQDSVQETRKRVEDTVSDIKDLVTNATASGLEAEAGELTELLRTLRVADRNTGSSLKDKKVAFGIFPPSAKDVKSDIPLPNFSGNPTDMDYYTFRREWDAYTGSKPMNEPEKFNVLIRSCLTGQVKTAVRQYKTTAEVLAYLQENYGNPRLLLAAKLEGIRKLGTSSGSYVKRREWAVDIRCKLKEVHTLAVEHELVDILHHSTIVGEIQNFLPAHEVRDFKKDVMKEDSLGMVSPVKYWELMSNFLDKLVKKLTFSINHDLNTGVAFSTDSKSRDKQKPPPTGGSSKVYTATMDEDNPAAPAAAAAAVHATTAKPKVKGGKTQKGGKKNIVNASINANVNVSSSYVEPKLTDCTACPNKHRYMFECEKFQVARGKDRQILTAKQKACFRCLRVDANYNRKEVETWWASHEQNCLTTWVCALDKCGTLPKLKQFHILMCYFHVKQNVEHERGFIAELDKSVAKPGLKFFFNAAMFEMNSYPAPPTCRNELEEDDILLPTIFMLQTVEWKGNSILIFYDTGCGGSAISDRAAGIFGSTIVREGPTFLSVAGGTTTELETGDERIFLPLSGSEKTAAITGLRMPSLTTKFPVWDIAEAWKLISDEISEQGHSLEDLPPRASKVGGSEVDIMVGIRYIKYHPTLLFILPSGLGVYRSKFASPNGEDCVLGGPHKAWEKCKEEINYNSPYSYFSSEMRAYFFCSTTLHFVSSPHDDNHVFDLLRDTDETEFGSDLECEKNPDQTDLFYTEFINYVSPSQTEPRILDPECTRMHCCAHSEDWIVPSSWDIMPYPIYTIKEDSSRFLKGELVASEIGYRCVRCRNCSSCRNSEQLEAVSYREEAEQSVIENAVEYRAEQKKLISSLPFITNPDECLHPNRYSADKILTGQLKRISQNEDTKEDVMNSFNKLASRGYLVPISTLPDEQKELVVGKPGYFIPWRTVHKEGSLSTPVRIVFDASSKTPGGSSLNDALAKGENRISSLYNILLRFRCRAAAFCCDIRLAYNQIELEPEHYRYQKFLWQEDLDPEGTVEEYVIRTLIYGVRPVGNSLIAGFSKLCDYVESQYPDHLPGARALRDSAYVDDILESCNSPEEAEATAESLAFVLSLAGMEVKGFTHSGKPPPEDVSPDGKSVGIIGMTWEPESDTIGLDPKPLYFGKPKRGKLPELVTGDFVPALKKHFTRRSMLSKVAGIFDPLGLVTPVTARFKLDLHDLVDQKLPWDELISDSYLETWIRNIEDMQELREVRFRRTIIPEDAVSPDVELIVSADASMNIAVACVHARVKKKDGTYSCQLVTGKSKLVNKLTIPKAELRAATLAVHLAHSVKFSLGSQMRQSVYVTDSSIVLHWLSNDQRPLETLVRNSVIDIRRFTSPSQWHHIESELNIADLGTRLATVEEVGWDSDWQNGKDWMRMDWKDMPLKTVEQTKLSQEEKRVAATEIRNGDISGIILPLLTSKVADRYNHGLYIVDPNKYNWPRATRAMAMILKFLRLCVKKWKPEWAPHPGPDGSDPAYCIPRGTILSKHDLKFGERYFYYVGTREVEQYVPKKDLRDSDKRGGILYYTGRILDGHTIDSPVDSMFDCPPLKFVQPILDRYSPVAYAVMVHVHNTVTNHRGPAVCLRVSREYAYILRGRDLAIEVRDGCRACTRYRARLQQVEMGKIHDNRLTIAPPFYISQVDLMGPFDARCNHNHRSVVKVWGCLFKDPSSGALSVHAMTSYSTDAFLDAYTRFSARYGHPSYLHIDEGSQLMKACKDMELSLVNINNNLSVNYGVGVQHSTCPVGGHNQQGCVERSVKSVKNLMQKVYKGIRMDIMSYETCFAWISSSLNNLPIAIGSKTTDLCHVDLITPSRLLLGRSSDRASGGYARITPPSKLVEAMDQVYKSWWTVWKDEKLTDFIPQPGQWRESNDDLKEGDIVMMLMNSEEAKLGGPIWKLARVQSVETSHKDGRVRTAICEYKNPGETVMRTTRRSVRKLAVVHKEDDLDLVQQLNLAAKQMDIEFHRRALKNDL